MAESEGGNIIGIRDVYNAVIRLDGKWDEKFEVVAARIDRVESRQDRNDGRLDMVKWLGPTGIAALILGLLVMSGVITPA
jgi:hypothetical protein